MDICFFTDPHLGLSRSSHTTSQSQKRLKEHLYNKALNITHKAKTRNQKVVCVGDLFDRYSNPEAVIEQGMMIASQCDLVVSGNHDVKNREDAVGSIQLLKHSLPEKIVFAPFGTKEFVVQRCGYVSLVAVPHVSGQDLFDAVLDEAKEQGKQEAPKYKILLLHCNYDRDFGHEIENDPALNLSVDKAKDLLEVFDYILIGHEHEPMEDLDGRVKILGNIMPLGFGEVSDRYSYTFTSEGEFTTELIWSAEDSFRKFTVEEVLDMAMGEDFELPVGVTMVEITGSLKAADYPDFSRALVKLWRYNEELLMVRPNVEVSRIAEKQSALPSFVRATIPQMVAADLEGTELAAAYKELALEDAEDD